MQALLGLLDQEKRILEIQVCLGQLEILVMQALLVLLEQEKRILVLQDILVVL
jgi:hypothetical protein